VKSENPQEEQNSPEELDNDGAVQAPDKRASGAPHATNQWTCMWKNGEQSWEHMGSPLLIQNLTGPHWKTMKEKWYHAPTVEGLVQQDMNVKTVRHGNVLCWRAWHQQWTRGRGSNRVWWWLYTSWGWGLSPAWKSTLWSLPRMSQCWLPTRSMSNLCNGQNWLVTLHLFGQSVWRPQQSQCCGWHHQANSQVSRQRHLGPCDKTLTTSSQPTNLSPLVAEK